MGYNDAARAMIRRAKRQCDVCRYGPWSRTWHRVSSKNGKNIERKTLTFFRSRICQVCGLKDVQTSYKSKYRIRDENGSFGEWKPGSIADAEPAFSESYNKE